MPELIDVRRDGLEIINGQVVARIIIRITNNESAPVTLVGYCAPQIARREVSYCRRLKLERELSMIPVGSSVFDGTGIQ